ISGAYSDRPQLAKAIAALSEGDTLVVCKLDRLARSTRDLLNTLDAIGKIGASFKSLNDPWADTTTPHGRLPAPATGAITCQGYALTNASRVVWSNGVTSGGGITPATSVLIASLISIPPGITAAPPCTGQAELVRYFISPAPALVWRSVLSNLAPSHA